MKVVVIDYGSGNLQSVANALASLNSGHELVISNEPKELRLASHIILPGVSAFADCMQGLRSKDGLVAELHKQVMIERKPFLGICVGMQVLASIGYENGEVVGLGFIDGKVIKIETQAGLKIPHMGWNELVLRESLEQDSKRALKQDTKDAKATTHPILRSIKNGDHVYFANSYHFLCQNEGNILAQVEYGIKINAIIAKKNIVGVQFHPEKSGEVGLQILKNFLNWRF